MKLKISMIDAEFLLTSQSVLTLSFEEKPDFSKRTLDIISTIEGDEENFIVFEGNKTLEPSKVFAVIRDFLTPDLDSKKTQTHIFDEMSHNIENNELLFEEYSEIQRRVTTLVENAKIGLDYAISSDESICLGDLFKSMNTKITAGKYDFKEKLIINLEIRFQTAKTKCFVLVSPRQYFSPEELTQIFDYCVYSGFIIITLESLKINNSYKNEMVYNVSEDGEVAPLAPDLS